MRVQDGQVTDDLDARQMAAEDLMLGMRMARGVPDEQVARAAALLPDVPAAFAELEALGLVERAGGRFRPTERGWLCGNELLRPPVRPGPVGEGRFRSVGAGGARPAHTRRRPLPGGFAVGARPVKRRRVKRCSISNACDPCSPVPHCA